MYIFIFLCLLSQGIFANPCGHKILEGQVKIQPQGNKLNIQASDRAIIQWENFSINPSEITKFIQPSKNAIVVNNVVGTEISKICGRLEANGLVYLINPQGILISKSGVIETNGFIGSSLELVDKDFKKGKPLLFKGSSTSTIENLGTIKALDGSIFLLGYEIKNKGTLEAKKNTIGLACGNEITLQSTENQKLFIKIDAKSLGILENEGVIEALKTEFHGCTNPFTYAIKQTGIIKSTLSKKNGEIYLKAYRGKTKISGELQSANGKTHIIGSDLEITSAAKIEDSKQGIISIDLSGRSLSHKGLMKTEEGTISINAENALFSHEGVIDSSGNVGGIVSIKTKSFINSGVTKAEGCNKNGGEISYHIEKQLKETKNALTSVKGNNIGGKIWIQMGDEGSFLSSGLHDASGHRGGQIHLLSHHILLPAAKIYANGLTKGGSIHIGKTPSLYSISTESAEKFICNNYTTIQANGGKKNGTVHMFRNPEENLSPNLIGIKLKEHPLGEFLETLPNGNIVHVQPNNPVADGADIGSFSLYQHLTGELICYATGRTPNDRIGSGGALSLNGNVNFSILSPHWHHEGAPNAGAATWVNGLKGFHGKIDASNSLHGTNANSLVGTYQIPLNNNGNYVVLSPYWNDWYCRFISDAGAATWIDGNTGYPAGSSGPGMPVTTANSLYGTCSDDRIGAKGAAEPLVNGNYVILSCYWQNEQKNSKFGAATWINGTTGYPANSAGPGAPVSTTNSLYGTTPNDQVGSSRALELEINGNYVVLSPLWNNGNKTNNGAATWMNGSNGCDALNNGPGAFVNTANSLYGPSTNDCVGFKKDIALTNGNYVVISCYWHNINYDSFSGAATWVNGSNGIPGNENSAGSPVTLSNSLCGSGDNDYIAYDGGLALENGNYIILSSYWSEIESSAGATTLMSGVDGKDMLGDGPGVGISTFNSLYGTALKQRVGKSATIYSNTNYTVFSKDNVETWINGTDGKDITGNGPGVSVNTTNSLTKLP